MNKTAIGLLLVLSLVGVLGACGGAETTPPAGESPAPAESPSP